jgi:hypothetical protein
MSNFQHVAVDGGSGPHVTVLAGVEMAGRYWATTSAAAAKIRMIRRAPQVAVLSFDDASRTSDTGGTDWSLVTGRAVVLDSRRPCDGLTDPLAPALAGVALARIGLANWQQLIGYVDDLGGIPGAWRPTSRVLLVVNEQSRLTVSNGEATTATGRFAASSPLPKSTRRRRHRLDAELISDLTSAQRSLVSDAGPCVLGLTTSIGPVAMPCLWDPVSGTVRVGREVLSRLGMDLPGPCSVTFDQSHDTHPSAKLGVMLRGHAALPSPALDADPGAANLAVSVQRVTSWDGFASSTRPR